MEIGSLQIKLFADMARLTSDMNKAVKTVDTSMKSIERSVGFAKNALGSIGAGASLASVAKIADSYKKFDSQLKLATNSVEDYNKAYGETIRIARQSQSSLEGVGVLYARISNNLRDFGATQKEVSAITETVTSALRVSNATTAESASVMLQLSQAFGAGRLNGQEFSAVAENAPLLLRELARSMGVTFGELKKLGAEGKITGEELKKAFTNQEFLNGLREQVKQVGTISSAFTVFRNNLTQYIGEADKANGASRSIAQGITFLADNIGTLANIAIAGAVVSLVKYSQGVMAGIAASKLKQAELIKETVIQERAAAATLAATQAEFALGQAKNSNKIYYAKNLGLLNEHVNVLADIDKKTTTAAKATRALGTVFSLFGGWIGIALTGLVLFGDKIVDFGKKTETATQKATNAIIEAQRKLDELNKSQRQQESGNALLPDLDAAAKRLADAYKPRKNALGNMVSAPQEEIELAKKSLEQIQELYKKAGAITGNVGIEKLPDSVKLLSAQIKEQNEIMRIAKVQLDANKISQADYNKVVKDAQTTIDGLTGATKANKAAQKDANAERKLAMDTIKEQFRLEDEADIKATADAYVEQQKALEEYRKSLQAMVDDTSLLVEKQKQETESIQRKIDILGLSESAVNSLELATLNKSIAEYEDGLAIARNNGLTAEKIDFIEQQISALKNLSKERAKTNAAIDELAIQEARVKADKDANEKIKKQHEDLAKDINRSLTDALLRGFEKGKSFAQNFKDTLINMFKSLVLQPTIQAILAPVTGAVASVLSGSANASTGSSVLSGLSSGKGILDFFTSGSSGQLAALDATVQSFSQTVSNMGLPKLGAALFQNSSAISSALPYAGAFLSALTGNFKGAAISGAATAIGSLTPLGPIGGAIIGQVLGGVFGGGHVSRPKYYANANISSNGSSLVSSYGNSDAKGNGSGVATGNTLGVGDGVLAYAKAFEGVIKNFKLGLNYQQKYDTFLLSLGKDISKNGLNADVEFKSGRFQEGIATTFLKAIKKGFVQLPEVLAGIVKRSSVSLDSALGDIQNLATIKQLSESLKDLPPVFDAINFALKNSVLSDAAKLTASANAISTYTSLFYTQQEAFDTYTKQLQSQLSALGTAIPKSRDDFRSLVDGIKVTDTSSSNLFNGLIALAPAMDAYYKQLESQNEILKSSTELLDVSNFKTQFDYNFYKGLADNYGNDFANRYNNGEMVTYGASNNTSVGMSSITPSNNTTISTSDPNLLNAMTTLIARVDALQTALDKTQDNTKRTAQVLVNVSPLGDSIQTKAVT